jgi:hypothetical protein
MKTLNVIGVIVAESIIALVGIAIVTAGDSLLLVQSAGATTLLYSLNTVSYKEAMEENLC